MSALSIASDIASISTAVIAALALKLASNQVAATNRTAREASATELYNNCLVLALENPLLADPDRTKFSGEQASSYRWFVASVLLSSEQILEVTDGDIAWRNSVKSTLRRHSQYLADRQAVPSTELKKFYHARLVKLADEVVAERGQPHGVYE